jgi:hypothetical protein
MTYALKYLFVAFAAATICNSVPTRQPADCRLNDRDSIPKLVSGYYGAVIDSSRKQGFKVYNTDDFYYLFATPAETLEMVDSLFKDYDAPMQHYMLVFHFNKSGSAAWFDFTMQHRGEHIALVLDNRIIWTPTIVDAMNYAYLAGGYSERQIDSFRLVFDREIKLAKANKGLLK